MGGLQCQARWQVCRDNCDRGRRWHFPDTDCVPSAPQNAFFGKAAPGGSPFECPPGCAPTAAQCGAALSHALLDAIRVTKNAVAKLEGAMRDSIRGVSGSSR
jgi:hypothetical protein